MNSRNQRTGTRLKRVTALLVVLLLALHSAPVTLCGIEGASPLPGNGGCVCFKPLPVCDDGQGFTNFLADHPWLSAHVVPLLFVYVTAAPFIAAGEVFSPGFPPSLFRPPKQDRD